MANDCACSAAQRAAPNPGFAPAHLHPQSTPQPFHTFTVHPVTHAPTHQYTCPADTPLYDMLKLFEMGRAHMAVLMQLKKGAAERHKRHRWAQRCSHPQGSRDVCFWAVLCLPTVAGCLGWAARGRGRAAGALLSPACLLSPHDSVCMCLFRVLSCPLPALPLAWLAARLACRPPVLPAPLACLPAARSR